MIGELKHRITIQEVDGTTINENGYEITKYKNIKTVWAKISNLSGKEFYEAANVQKEKTVVFKIRAGIKLDESMRILFNDKYYDITFIDNVNYENRYIEIKAMECDRDVQD